MSTKILIFVILNFMSMYYVYTLAEPTTNEIRYVGITTNLNVRLISHLTSFTESNPKCEWVVGLRQKGLKPIMNVIDTANNKKEALLKESDLIITYKKQGLNLLNVNYRKLYYKYDLEGNLLDIVSSLRQDGYKVRIDRLTHNGIVWNDEPIFPKWKLEKLKESKAVNRKEIHQYTKDGIFVNTFEGVREAHRITNIDHRSISACATFRRPSAGGYVWRYEKQISYGAFNKYNKS